MASSTVRSLVVFATLVLMVRGVNLEERKPWCPEGWDQSQCLGTSGALAEGQAADAKGKITWAKGMASHTHYDINPKTTALFVIDPQAVYAKCPKKLEVADLIANPSSKDFDGHSPLCCENFDDVVDKENQLAEQARKVGMPVFVHAHVYRDLDGDKEIDNLGRIGDFDVLGWAGWPMAWNLWSEAFPWHVVTGFKPDYKNDYYAEKSTYSAMTKPVVAKLKALGVDTVIITGFLTQFCSVTTSRHAHDLGFKVIFVTDANDGPVLLQKLSGTDENKFIPFTLGVVVADTITTGEVLESLGVKGASPGSSKRLYLDAKNEAQAGEDPWQAAAQKNEATTSTFSPLVLALAAIVPAAAVLTFVAGSRFAMSRQQLGASDVMLVAQETGAQE